MKTITTKTQGATQSGLGTWVMQHWVVLAISSWLVSGALYLTLPPSSDQFNHAYLGWRLLEGDIPYRDVIDMNWPGVMALHALASWIFGVNIWSWRAFDFLLFAVSALFLSDLVRLAAGRDAGRLSLILCPLIYASASWWLAGQHDMSAAQLLVVALWFHVRGYEEKSWWWQLGTGLFLGLAMLNKPTVGVMGVLLPLQALWLRTPVFIVVARSLVAGAAALATLFAALAALLYRGALLDEIVGATYTYNTMIQLLSARSAAGIVDAVVSVRVGAERALVWGWWSALMLGSVPAIVWIVRGPVRSIATTALPLLWITGVLSYVIQWVGMGYHLAPSFVALAGGMAISAALVVNGRLSIGGTTWQRTIGIGLVAGALVVIVVKLVDQYHSLPSALLAGNYGWHLSRFKENDGVTVADTVAFARRLDKLPKGDCVLFVGTVSSINYLSRRRQPTRFYYLPVIINARPPLPMAERWLDLWERDLKAATCRVAVVTRGVRAEWIKGSSRAGVALREFLDGYRESGVLGADGAMVIYERK